MGNTLLLTYLLLGSTPYVSFTDQKTKTQKYKVISPAYTSEGAGV